MKIRIEADGTIEGTEVFIDGVSRRSDCCLITFEHVAAQYPKLTVRLFKRDASGSHYVDPQTARLAYEDIQFEMKNQ